MEITYIIIGGTLLLGVIIYLKNRAKKSTSKVIHAKDNAYEGLRNIAFSVSPDSLGLTLSKDKKEVYGVIMDWEMGGAIATTTAYMTGDASMYTSTGGGIIGGGQHQNVNSAAKQLIKVAQTYLDKAIKTETTPLPQTNIIRFYLLTNMGVYVGQEVMSNFENNSSKWFGLFVESNKVLTELRRISSKT